jgi:hypothetical protein
VRNALNMAAITSCYRGALRNGAAPATRVTARFDLETDMRGGVSTAMLSAPQLGEPLRHCVEQVARKGRVREVDTGVAQASVLLVFQPR